MKKTIRLCALVILAAVGSVCAGETLNVEGSTTVGPIGQAIREVLIDMYDDIEITINETGSGHGAKALMEGRCDIAMMSRFMKPEEFTKCVQSGIYPVAHVIAMDGISMIVHPSNPVKGLTKNQIRDIYTGKITNWKQLGGPDLEIIPVSRDIGSGTYETFNNIIMQKQEMAGHVEMVSANPQAFANIKTTRGAIGYVGHGFVRRGVKPIEVDGIASTRENILSGKYAIGRPLFMFTNGYPESGSLMHKFCTFYLCEEGQLLIEEKGFVPVTDY